MDKYRKDDLERLYWEEKKSMGEIGEIYGCTQSNIAHYFRKFGIPKRTIKESRAFLKRKDGSPASFPEITVEKIMEMVNSGMLIKDISEHLQLSKHSIGKRLKNAGINLKNHPKVIKELKERMKTQNPVPKGSNRDKRIMKSALEGQRKMTMKRRNNITTYKQYGKIARYIAYWHYERGAKIPEGMVIDHIFSVYDGWNVGVHVDDISNPVNLRLIPAQSNLEKHYQSHMTFEEFKNLVGELKPFKQPEIRKCLNCEKEIEPKPQRKYCNDKCGREFRVKQELYGTATCLICGKDFNIIAIDKKSTTCSRNCSNKLKGVKRKAANR